MKTMKALCVCWFSFGVVVACVNRTAGDDEKEPKHLREALQLVEHLSLKNTSYTHSKADVQFDDPYRSHTDCSGFLGALLERSYGCTPEQFEDWFGKKRPTADHFHDAITKGKGFKQILDFRNAVAGDVLAVKYEHPKDKNTGHIMLVAAAPKRMKTSDPVKPDTEQWEVPIIDSSRSGHGKSDTRHGKGEDGKDHEGLGKGVLRVYTDKDGKVVGYTWSVAGTKFQSQEEDNLVVGHFKR
jgi:hypothetical protein